MPIEAAVGRYVLDQFRAPGRARPRGPPRPDVTSRIEVAPGPALVYARKSRSPARRCPRTRPQAGIPVSGRLRSASPRLRVVERGAHLSFGARLPGQARAAGESSLHVATGLARQLVRYQFNLKLYRVPFESIQREIVRYAPEDFRILLDRRMMLRIAQVIAKRERALALVTGDSLGQVASQTLRNLVAVDAAATVPVFRPLIGADKLEILATARKIGTYDISSEPFHDCCPVFLPRRPALFASPADLDAAESHLDVPVLVTQGLTATTIESLKYAAGEVTVAPPVPQEPGRQWRVASESVRPAFAFAKICPPLF